MILGALLFVGMGPTGHADEKRPVWYCYSYRVAADGPTSSRCTASEKICDITRNIDSETADGVPVDFISLACVPQPKAAVLTYHWILRDIAMSVQVASIKECKRLRKELLEDDDVDRVGKCRVMTPKQAAKIRSKTAKDITESYRKGK